MGRPSRRSWLLRDPDAKFLVGRGGPNTNGAESKVVGGFPPDCWRPFRRSSFLLSGRGVQSGPQQSRTRGLSASAAFLDGEDCSEKVPREGMGPFLARSIIGGNKRMSNNPDSTPKLSDGQLELLFRRLNLANTRRIYQEVAHRAEKEGWAYRDFLALLLAEEVAHRKQTRLQRFTRKARFPFFKTIDEFDFSLQTTLRQSLLGSYLGPDFVTEGRSLILYGKTGRGKTHLAVAIGYRAIQNGFETLCTSAAELIENLSNASKRGQLQDALLTYTRPHVLVIDEVGYLSYG